MENDQPVRRLAALRRAALSAASIASSRSGMAREPAAGSAARENGTASLRVAATFSRGRGAIALKLAKAVTNRGASSSAKTAASATRFSSTAKIACSSPSGKLSGPSASRMSRTAVANSLLSKRAAAAASPCSRNTQMRRAKRARSAKRAAPPDRGMGCGKFKGGYPNDHAPPPMFALFSPKPNTGAETRFSRCFRRGGRNQRFRRRSFPLSPLSLLLVTRPA